MADAAITFLLDNLTRIVSQEADLLFGVKDEVGSLQLQLEQIQSFLKDFRKNKRNDQYSERMVTFNKQLRKAAHEAEDIIDQYVVIISELSGENLFTRLKTKLLDRRRVANEIQGIKKRFNKIYESREGLADILIPPQQQHDQMEEDNLAMRRRRRSAVEETDIVGFDGAAQAILDRITKGVARRDVVPIVGMAGIGKTTLARKVYNDPIITQHFDFRAWVYVSEGYKVKDLLQSILKIAKGLSMEQTKGSTEEELEKELRHYLSSTRYLIVLDDVWSTDFWEDLKGAFPDMIGSRNRIILTTRDDGVAQHVNPSEKPHRVHFLSGEESWELLSKKVFPFPDVDCPSDLEKLGKEMAKQCGGLPLAIVVLSGVLLKKGRILHKWSKVSSKVSSLLIEPKSRCSEILTLSYDNLPDHLKDCFLYFGLYPKDSEIPATKLVRLWIAEGFVEKRDGETMEEVGEDYLEDLVARNLIQVSKRRYDETIKTCSIHDLLQELCIRKAKEDNFLEVLKNRSSSIPSSPSASSSVKYNSRRLGLLSNMSKYISTPNPSPSMVRSIMCFGLDEPQLLAKEWKSLYKSFPLLKVLDPGNVGVEDIPKEIHKLIHLRYLKLKSQTAKTLPASICNLWNLQTLEVSAPRIDAPPLDIWKMKELRHLHFHGLVVLPEPPKEKVLKNTSSPANNHVLVASKLLTLAFISPDNCTETVLAKLPNLRKLGIHGDLEKNTSQGKTINLSGLICLQALRLERDRRCEVLVNLGNGIRFPPNLTKLTLLETQLMEDPMDVLGQLPNLKALKLKNAAYSGRDLNCPTNRFPKLQVFKLVNLAIRSWTVSEGSMPSLACVVIKRCGNLNGLPCVLRNMNGFKGLELWSRQNSLVNQAREIETSKGKEQFKLVIYQS